MRRSLALFALVLASAALAACGGGGKSSSASSGPTHAEYVAKANAICAATGRQTAPLIAKIKSSATALLTGGAAAVVTPVTRLHDVAAANVAKLRALAQPAGDRAKIARVLGPLAKIVKLIGAAAKDLGAGKVLNAVALIQQAQPLAGQVSSAARALGAGRCGQVLAALG
jgi:hypothetical protein